MLITLFALQLLKTINIIEILTIIGSADALCEGQLIIYEPYTPVFNTHPALPELKPVNISRKTKNINK